MSRRPTDLDRMRAALRRMSRDELVRVAERAIVAVPPEKLGPLVEEVLPTRTAPRFTARQGQVLAFIVRYTRNYGVPPAEADIARHFMIWPESAHQMVVTLERRELIAREPRRPRSIRVLVPDPELPHLA